MTDPIDHKESERYKALERQFTAVTSPTAEELHSSARIRGAILDVAWLIETSLPKSRHKSLAFTLLEDVQMRANRGILSTED